MSSTQQPASQNGVEAVLLTKAASFSGGGKVQTEGVLTLTTARLRWQPNNASAAQPVTIQTSSILSACAAYAAM